MEQDTILKLENSIENLKSKKSRIYLFTQDTKVILKLELGIPTNWAWH